MSVMLIAQPTSFVFLRWKSVIRPVTRGMPAGVLHRLRIWLLALGVHRISKANTLIRSELHADGITKPIQDKEHSCYCTRARAADDRHGTVSHVMIPVSFWLEYCLIAEVSLRWSVSQCFPFPGTLTGLYTVAGVWHLGLKFGQLMSLDIIRAACYSDT